MSFPTPDLESLRRSWSRLVYDLSERAFAAIPMDRKLVEIDLDAWLSEAGHALGPQFAPKGMSTIDVPKAGGTTRPGSLLTMEDRLAYTYYLGACFPRIREAVHWARNVVDYSYPLASGDEATKWVKNAFEGWRAFRERSLELLSEGYTFVVFSDISGFYENIDLSILSSDLRSVGVTDAIIRPLSTCLNRWAEPRRRGIPQGATPSDILAKLYLNNIDLALRDRGMTHLRYVDDYRLFCSSRVEAKRALVLLSELLRNRGLNVQSAKSQIVSAEQARLVIDGVQPMIQGFARRLSRRKTVIAQDIEYLGEGLAAFPPKSHKPSDAETLRVAFDDFFGPGSSKDFNRTLFHFLLERLGQSRDRHGLDSTLRFLISNPEETSAILKYVGLVAGPGPVDAIADDLLDPEKQAYEYQAWQYLSWRLAFQDVVPNEVLHFVRRIAFGGNMSGPVWTSAVDLLGSCGEPQDFEQIEAAYAKCPEALARAHLICAMRRQEKGRRNNFYARCASDGSMEGRAVAWVKQSGIH